ncbi:MAG TPA: ADP-ribosylglycohydrolase family protein [Candidatus Deferrimicrobium sp.]|nr:ADP-ribosylglycohydrolase family protein [Candidatus Deferrimicrobium sp.]
MKSLKSRFIGTLIGTGVGDALGRPFEGWSRRQIEAEVGRISELLSNTKPAGQYTDDTQLTIAIAESLIRSKGFNLGDLMNRFIEWLSEPPIGPGYGCISSIEKFKRGFSWEAAASESGGNGTAMRVSPIGLFYYNDIPLLIENARMSSVITHRHWAATASAIIVAWSVGYLLQVEELDINDFLNKVASVVQIPEFKNYATNILKIKDFLRKDPVDALIELGGMGIEPPWPNPTKTRQGFTAPYAMSTTLSAFYCFLLSPEDFENSVIEAVMSGGDTDTCGAITGAISGSFNGIEKIPPRWKNGLVNGAYIEKLAMNLFSTAHDFK